MYSPANEHDPRIHREHYAHIEQVRHPIGQGGGRVGPQPAQKAQDVVLVGVSMRAVRPKNFVVLVLALLAVVPSLLTSCLLRRVGTTWILSVANFDEREVDGLFTPPCGGALSASVSVAGMGPMSALASLGERFDQFEWRHEGRVRVGAPVRIEAVCTDSDDLEIGYALVEGTISIPPYDGYGGGTWVRPGVVEGEQEGNACLKASQARGRAPCISESFVRPN